MNVALRIARETHCVCRAPYVGDYVFLLARALARPCHALMLGATRQRTSEGVGS